MDKERIQIAYENILVDLPERIQNLLERYCPTELWEIAEQDVINHDVLRAEQYDQIREDRNEDC